MDIVGDFGIDRLCKPKRLAVTLMLHMGHFYMGDKMKFRTIGVVFSGMAALAAFTAGANFAAADSGQGMGKHGQFLEQRFEQSDTNKDGQVSLDEFLASQEERAKARFKRIDSNDDGSISKSEMEDARDNMQKKFKEYHDQQSNNPANPSVK